MAASFAVAIPSQDSLLDLMFVGPEAYCFTAGRGLAHADRMLEVLAGVEPVRGPALPPAPRLGAADGTGSFRAPSGVLLGWDDERRAFVAALRDLEIPTLTLVVTRAGEADLEPEGAAERGAHTPPAGWRDASPRGWPACDADQGRAPPLLALALVFWGWQTGLWPAAILMAAIVRARASFPGGGILARADFNRVSDLCSIILVGLYRLSRGHHRCAADAHPDLPVVSPGVAALLPRAALQHGRRRGPRIFLSGASARKPTPTAPRRPARVDLSYPYFVICILAASAANSARRGLLRGGPACWAPSRSERARSRGLTARLGRAPPGGGAGGLGRAPRPAPGAAGHRGVRPGVAGGVDPARHRSLPEQHRAGFHRSAEAVRQDRAAGGAGVRA